MLPSRGLLHLEADGDFVICQSAPYRQVFVLFPAADDDFVKNIYDQAIDSVIKRYEKIRKLTTRQGEDYTTGCLLGHDYMKNHYRLMAVDLSRQKELDADPKAIQQIEFVG